MALMCYFIDVSKKLKYYKYYIMANISRNNASVLMIISTLIIIFILVTFFVISENNFNDNLEQGAASANNNVSPNNVNANNNANGTAEEESEVDYSGYNNDRKQVFNVSENDYTYEEARALCKAYGGDLATLEQMIEAHKKGANWCNYGWSDGQMALYPTQVEEYNKLEKYPNRAGECGKPGVNGGYFENPNLKFGANCYAVKPAPKDDEIHKDIPNYSLDPLAQKIAMYEENLDDIGVSPFSGNKWSYYQPDTSDSN